MKYKQSALVDGMSFAKPDYIGTFKDKMIVDFKEQTKLVLGTVGAMVALYFALVVILA